MQLVHGKVALWLEELRAGSGPKLLLLHALAGSSRDFSATRIEWPGAVHALDFSGHGRSGRLIGGGYHPELLAADADVALAHLGCASILGMGLGAYVGLLVAGARPALVPALALLDGAGLRGGGAEPDFARAAPSGSLQPADVSRALQDHPGSDAAATAKLGSDVRPVDYVSEFAAAAQRVVLVDDGQEKPAWWQAVARVPGVRSTAGGFEAALAALADARDAST